MTTLHGDHVSLHGDHVSLHGDRVSLRGDHMQLRVLLQMACRICETSDCVAYMVITGVCLSLHGDCVSICGDCVSLRGDHVAYVVTQTLFQISSKTFLSSRYQALIFVPSYPVLPYSSLFLACVLQLG